MKRKCGLSLQEGFYTLCSKLEKCMLRIFPFKILNLICACLSEPCLGFAHGRNQLMLKCIYPAKVQTFQICWDSDYRLKNYWNKLKQSDVGEMKEMPVLYKYAAVGPKKGNQGHGHRITLLLFGTNCCLFM